MPLRAVHAMHTILTRMVLFRCFVCNERFPTFHPAYVPPPSVAKDMEILKRGGNGVAACNVEVHSWDALPPLAAPDGVAMCCFGTCWCCQKDMDDQLKAQGGDEESAVTAALEGGAERARDRALGLYDENFECVTSHRDTSLVYSS